MQPTVFLKKTIPSAFSHKSPKQEVLMNDFLGKKVDMNFEMLSLLFLTTMIS